MEKLTGLLTNAAAALLPEERGQVVVFGSSAVVLHGVHLGREIDDLDLFGSDAVFDKMSSRFPSKTKVGKDGEKVVSLIPGEDIEIHKSFPGVVFADVFAHASKLISSQEFLVGSLDDIKSWKREQGRPKDFKDIEAIESAST